MAMFKLVEILKKTRALYILVPTHFVCVRKNVGGVEKFFIVPATPIVYHVSLYKWIIVLFFRLVIF